MVKFVLLQILTLRGDERERSLVGSQHFASVGKIFTSLSGASFAFLNLWLSPFYYSAQGVLSEPKVNK